MKILFLCGSLEPGRDGVGDYTRRLAIELMRKGNQTSAIALNDFAINKVSEGIQYSENMELAVLRIPSSWTAKRRFGYAKDWIDKFNPAWISLQFVIFSFHYKGLPFGLSRLMGNIGKKRRWHLMFHELWVGMPVGASKKHIFWGWLQQRIIRSLLIKLKPEVIHTQSKLYLAQLNKLGFDVNYLPLFSNIPVTENFSGAKNNDAEKNKKDISIVVFGTIHPHAPVKQLVKEVLHYMETRHAKVSLMVIGRSGMEQEHWVSVWRSAKLAVEILGEQPIACISNVLNNASIGISTSALAMIDKSGTVAAMIEHQLPVICVSKPWVPRGTTLSSPLEGIVELKDGCIETCLTSAPQKTFKNNISDIASEFISRLSKAQQK